MSISIIKPKWNAEIEAYIATIDGKKFIIDIDAPTKSEPSKSADVQNRSLIKGKKGKAGKPLKPSTLLIKSGATFEDVLEKFPKFKRSNYDQTRGRLGLSKKRKANKTAEKKPVKKVTKQASKQVPNATT